MMHWSTEQSPSASSTGRTSGSTSRGSGNSTHRGGAAERFQRPHPAAHQFVDHPGDQDCAAGRRRPARARCPSTSAAPRRRTPARWETAVRAAPPAAGRRTRSPGTAVSAWHRRRVAWTGGARPGRTIPTPASPSTARLPSRIRGRRGGPRLPRVAGSTSQKTHRRACLGSCSKASSRSGVIRADTRLLASVRCCSHLHRLPLQDRRVVAVGPALAGRSLAPGWHQPPQRAIRNPLSCTCVFRPSMQSRCGGLAPEAPCVTVT